MNPNDSNRATLWVWLSDHHYDCRMAYDEELADRLRELLEGQRGLSESAGGRMMAKLELPIACTLEGEQRPDRLAVWTSFLEGAVIHQRRASLGQ